MVPFIKKRDLIRKIYREKYTSIELLGLFGSETNGKEADETKDSFRKVDFLAFTWFDGDEIEMRGAKVVELYNEPSRPSHLTV